METIGTILSLALGVGVGAGVVALVLGLLALPFLLALLVWRGGGQPRSRAT